MHQNHANVSFETCCDRLTQIQIQICGRAHGVDLLAHVLTEEEVGSADALGLALLLLPLLLGPVRTMIAGTLGKNVTQMPAMIVRLTVP